MGGGLGWLTRRHGLASASLLAVDYVDVDGTERRTDEAQDADVLWSFRGGGGGAGIATRLHLRLFEHRSLHAGARFWAIEHLPEVLNSWIAWTQGAPTSVTSMCWALQAPDVPAMHEALRGRAVVAIGACVVDADDPEAIMRTCFAGLPQPLMDTYADRRADQLGDIHLDPPGPVPALGDGRLISRPGADEALAAFEASAIGDEGPLTLVEQRQLGGAAHTHADAGALTALDGDFTLGATGGAPTAELAASVRERLTAVMAATARFDLGVGVAALRGGRTDTLDALHPKRADRLRSLRKRRDPDRRLRPAMGLLAPVDETQVAQ